MLGATAAVALTAMLLSGVEESAHAATPDFLTDRASNAVAAVVGEELQRLSATNAGFAGVRITPAGLEVDVAGAASPALRAAVHNAQAATISGSGVPVMYRTVPFSMAELTQTTDQISAIKLTLRSSGIDLAAWGPDLASNTVLVRLRHYTPAAADDLNTAYGMLVACQGGCSQGYYTPVASVDSVMGVAVKLG